MESSEISSKRGGVRLLRLVVSMLAIGLVAAAALIVPYVVRTAHAAAPVHATNSCAQPPAGKDLTTLTPQQLRTYGLPPLMPHQNKAQWANMLRHDKHRICTTTPAKASGTRMRHALRGAGSSRPDPAPSGRFVADAFHDPGDYCNFCWGGYEANASNYNFDQANAQVTIPCSPVVPDQNSGYDAFLAIGGDTSPLFLSAGVDETTQTIDYVHEGITTQINYATYQLYFENDGGDLTGEPDTGENDLASVGCGDTIDLEVATPDYMYVGDETFQEYYGESYGPTPDTTKAECIVDTRHADMMDFGTVGFNYCEAIDANNPTGIADETAIIQGMDQLNPETDTIVDLNGQTMAVTNPFSACNGCGQFSVTWQQAN
jgi:hypothetical protein